MVNNGSLRHLLADSGEKVMFLNHRTMQNFRRTLSQSVIIAGNGNQQRRVGSTSVSP